MLVGALQLLHVGALHLHPDRLQDRDLSVRVEAEEVFKRLQAAHADKASWLKGMEECNPFAADSGTAGQVRAARKPSSNSCA